MRAAYAPLQRGDGDEPMMREAESTVEEEGGRSTVAIEEELAQIRREIDALTPRGELELQGKAEGNSVLVAAPKHGVATAEEDTKVQPLDDSLLGAGRGQKEIKGPATAPADRALRETHQTKSLVFGGLYFTPDAQTLVHGDYHATGLHLWDLRSGVRTDGGIERGAAIRTSAVSPEGRLLCIAALDGLAMFEFTQRSADGEEPRCEPLWEVEAGTHYAGVAFSRDSLLIAAVPWNQPTRHLEIRDALSSSIVKVIDDFPAVAEDVGMNAICFSDEVLAVAGKRNSKEVRLYSVKSDFQVLQTLTVPRENAHKCVSMSRSGRWLAVGMFPSAGVAVFSQTDGKWSDTPRCLVLPEYLYGPAEGLRPTDNRQVFSTSFSHDERLLCCGHNDAKGPCPVAAIWDLEAGLCIRAIPSKGEFTVAFSPASDLLAIAGENSTTGIMVHEVLPQQPLGTFALVDDPQHHPLAGACASNTVVLLHSVADGNKQLAAVCRRDSHVLWQQGEVKHIVLQPTGGQVAVCTCNDSDKEIVSLRDVETGHEMRQLGPFVKVANVAFSTDGSLIVICGGPGQATTVFDAASGQELQSFADGSKSVTDCAVHPGNTLILTTGLSADTGVLRDIKNGQIPLAYLREESDCFSTRGGCFSDSGTRIAFWNESLNNGITVNMTELQEDGALRDCWSVPVSLCELQFSPGDGKYLLCCGDPDGVATMRFLDSATGDEPGWSKCFRALMLPSGRTALRSIRWIRTADDAEQSTSVPPLIVHAAVDHQLFLIDVSAFIRSFEEDGNFSFEQLNRLSDSTLQIDADAIPCLLERWPHAIDVRDQQTGDTVLHRCARALQPEYEPETVQKWLSGAVAPTYQTNYLGRSALSVLITSRQLDNAKALVNLLNPDMPLSLTSELTRDLVTLLHVFGGRDAINFIQILQGEDLPEREPVRMPHFKLFRVQKEVSVLTHPLDPDLGYAVRASANGDGDEPWPDYFLDDYDEHIGWKTACSCELLVLALADFGGKSGGKTVDGKRYLSPYTKLFNFCAAGSEQHLRRLVSTELMLVVTTFKWQTYVRPRCLALLRNYVLHTLLAGTAMVTSTHASDEKSTVFGRSLGDWSIADFLVFSALITNSVVVKREVSQLLMDGNVREYLTQGWNLCDLAGIVALYGACAGHLLGAQSTVRVIGAVAVLLNAFSILPLLLPFRFTSLLVQTLIGMASDDDIRGYMVITVILLYGFSMAFSVSMPDDSGGPANSVLTSFEAMIGVFHLSDYDGNGEVLFFFLLFLFVMIIVLLNLLIAVMSDVYTDSKEKIESLMPVQRARLVVEHEAHMSDVDRANPEFFPRFLQVLRATEGDPHDSAEEGQELSNMVVLSEITKVEDRMKKNHEAMAMEVAGVKTSQDKMAAEVAELKAMVAELLGHAKNNGSV